jgi:acetyl esterase/lipase
MSLIDSIRWFFRLDWLTMKAEIWRWLMTIGMTIHHRAKPRPPAPSFVIKIPSRMSVRRGHFKLVFYVPSAYKTAPKEQRFPVVVNYHGGGFTLGSGTDDARWAQAVMETCQAVVVSVEYRLAPKYPFSVGVEDSADAVIYLAAHAEELRLDPHRIALSGFSAGGNYALTVPFVIYDLQHNTGRRSLTNDISKRPSAPSRGSSANSTASLVTGLRIEPASNSASNSSSSLSVPLPPTLEPTLLETSQALPPLTIVGLISFYPPTDFRIPREAKRATNPRPKMNLPPVLTNLFDESYMRATPGATHHFQKTSPEHPPVDMTDPYLSPAAASDDLLRAAYPATIVLYTCEFDMLNAEGVAFGERLSGRGVAKTVKGGVIHAVPHAFDKKPNPVKFSEAAEKCYGEACAELNVLFGRRESEEARLGLG